MPRRHPVYHTHRWRIVRALVLKRDGYRCVVCGQLVHQAYMARVDHIKPVDTHPELAFDLNNLRTLCTRCDNQSHREKPAKGAVRLERFKISGADANGWPKTMASPASSKPKPQRRFVIA